MPSRIRHLMIVIAAAAFFLCLARGLASTHLGLTALVAWLISALVLLGVLWLIPRVSLNPSWLHLLKLCSLSTLGFVAFFLLFFCTMTVVLLVASVPFH